LGSGGSAGDIHTGYPEKPKIQLPLVSHICLRGSRLRIFN
jgi:hypothetical protein